MSRSSEAPEQTPSEFRGFCPRCRQAASSCYCERLARQSSRARVVLLQHPREARNPIGTARMAHLSLPGSSLLIGVDFASDPEFQRLLAESKGAAAVLYPAEGSRDASELAAHEGPLTVFVIDGTWWQARKIWRSNPALHQLPAYRLQPSQPSRYHPIRAEPAPHCLSTIEAVAELLDAIAGTRGGHEPMLEPFLTMVDRQLDFAQRPGRVPRRRKRPRPLQQELPGPLRGRLQDALLFHAEGNGWPTAIENAPEPELLQWVAVRPSTGERFCAFVRPEGPLSPTVEQNLELAPSQFTGGLARAEFLARWEAFARPSDVWCSWGFYGAKLLAGAGGCPPKVVELRTWCGNRLGSRAGPIERAVEVLELPEPAPALPGRAGRRLAMLESIFTHLAAGSRDERAGTR